MCEKAKYKHRRCWSNWSRVSTVGTNTLVVDLTKSRERYATGSARVCIQETVIQFTLRFALLARSHQRSLGALVMSAEVTWSQARPSGTVTRLYKTRPVAVAGCPAPPESSMSSCPSCHRSVFANFNIVSPVLRHRLGLLQGETAVIATKIGSFWD